MIQVNDDLDRVRMKAGRGMSIREVKGLESS